MRRRKAREYALKILYMLDIRKEKDLESILEEFWNNTNENNKEIKDFAEELVRGIFKNMGKIDKVISEVSLNWRLDRMSFIDRNLIRIGAYEIIFKNEIPPAVSINEAIEISKKYGDSESPKFINGILHKIKQIYRNEIVEGKNEKKNS